MNDQWFYTQRWKAKRAEREIEEKRLNKPKPQPSNEKTQKKDTKQ
jgi:hypothetical protein